MSRMEVNKGKLIPFKGDIEKLAESLVPDLDLKYYKTKVEALKQSAEEYGEYGDYAMINGELYQVDWHCRGGDMEEGFAEVHKRDDGSVEFYTYHYNGGAHWTEVVEGELK